MQTFIQQLTDYVIENHSDHLGDICIVFPTRRAGLFFRDELSKKLTEPSWAPTIVSIQDFLLGMSDIRIPDQLTLMFELYKVYSKYFPDESFDSFYPWGELLLRDFNDLDNYLVEADKVFSMVNDLHQIETDFALPEEDMERIRSFWRNFFDHDPTRLKNEFMNTWKHLSPIYSDFVSVLASKNLGYEGMIYRSISSKIENHTLPDHIVSGKIIFAAFYALSPAEEKIIRFFLKEKSAIAFWDADTYYTDDLAQEAGKFFRTNKMLTKDFLWKQNHFASEKKTITMAGVPLIVGQAKYAGQLLTDLMKENNFIPERTAVVLPDEKLLFPVLYALPSELQNINVTMGYPVRQTPLYDLFESLMGLQRNARKENSGKTSFYFRDVKNILNHPYIRIIARDEIREWLLEQDENFIRIESEYLTSKKSKLFSELFYLPEDIEHVFLWMRTILLLILEGMKSNDFKFHKLESEFVFHFYTQLNRLEEIFLENKIHVDIETFRRIFKEIISTVRIPFSGEPLKGLQVMGFLETRVLDFDNLIILSVNEDTLPAAGNQPSFIPFNIRKAFGLPTYEEQHAVSAYHFYRLMQRAGNVNLIYNTEPSNLTAGEKSRFLLQIEYELLKKYPNSITLNKKTISTTVHKHTVEPIFIEKTEDVLKELSKFYTNDNGTSFHALSPSGLLSYLSCSLKFYFRYVAGLKEKEDDIEENMEAATFGSVLHKAMQLLYTGVPELNPTVVKALRKKVEAVVDEAIHEEFISIHQLEGKNILLRNVIQQLVLRILDIELMNGTVNLLQLEADVSAAFPINATQKVKMYGIIDRVDRVGNVVRIIDYKTGKVQKRKALEVDKLFSDPKYKEQFQAMYYAFFAKAKYPQNQIVSGIITLREMSEGIWFLNDSNPFSDEQFNEFDTNLKNLINEIMDPTKPFEQTKDTKRCEYCPFIEICNR